MKLSMKLYGNILNYFFSTSNWFYFIKKQNEYNLKMRKKDNENNFKGLKENKYIKPFVLSN